jgi:hypothetical protein
LEALVSGWKDDPDTLTFLKDRSQNDDDPIVRHVVLKVLARVWKEDSDVVDWLREMGYA